MQFKDNKCHLSATDLSNHLACSHLTQLEIKRAKNEIKKPVRKNYFLDRVIERGNQHEDDYVKYLWEDGTKTVFVLTRDESNAKDKTFNAMIKGIDVIVQGALGNEKYGGRPDFLIKKNIPSPSFGGWSYEVIDTKLTQTTKAGTILQLCVYSDLIAEIQGTAPEHMHVVMPLDNEELPFQTETHRYDDYTAYYRLAKSQLSEIIAAEPNTNSYPEPVNHCDICQWWPDCDKQRRQDDHLTFVAGIQKSHIKELKHHNIETLTKFATADHNTIQNINTISEGAITRTHQQAQIQHKGILSGKPEYELLDVIYPDEHNAQRRGLLKLPAPCREGDLFFDIESARHAPGGGLEYLLGFAHGETQNIQHPQFDYFWGLDRNGEKKAFEAFIDLAMERLRLHPQMHIYHFAPYEPAALKRLATRHATREDELDTLLRKQCFVDLYAITRQSIRASVESYSIKCLEQFYGYHREEELAEARLSMHRVEEALEIGATQQLQKHDMDVVLKYNRDDCISTIALRNWLEQLRTTQINNGIDLPRPPAPEDYTAEAPERSAEVAEVFNNLTDGLQGLPTALQTDEQKAKWLLAHCLEYFRREEKNAWWEYFRLRELDEPELLKERIALTGLKFIDERPKVGKERNVTHRYSFNDQFVTLSKGNALFEVSSEDGAPKDFEVGTVVSVDHNLNTIDIKKPAKANNKHPHAVFHHKSVRAHPMPQALLEFGKTVAAQSITDDLQTAQYDLLAKNPPRFKRQISISTVLDKALPTPETAYELIKNLDHSVLAIQGPPGTGKTYTGSRAIIKLAQQGKRIGITAVGHAVIANLLNNIADAADDTTITAHKGNKEQVTAQQCEQLSSNPAVLDALADGKIVGATAWTWASDALTDNKLDYLFIDEAGQMSLAMALAAARGAKNVVLLGDPQQLEQPQKATHPEGSEVAALAHLIGDRQTISNDQGLFLDTTYRMHPTICNFTSSQYYEARLKSHPDLINQVISGSSPIAQKQLIYTPVPHTGNQSSCEEEAQAIKQLISTLLTNSHQWVDSNGASHTLQARDILIVAPYNAQVGLLKQLLPEISNIGTVDKFQGQQAPIVIYSMTSSTTADAPRGMSFLFSPNRFNVATSRAKCTVIVFGSPDLIMAECKTPEQIKWANGLCRYVESADTWKAQNGITSNRQRELYDSTDFEKK